MNRPYPPKNIKIILFLQLVGVFLLASAHYAHTPILIFTIFSLGSGMVVISVLYWLYLMSREFRTIINEIQNVFTKSDQR